jgi:hypothetical protein
MTLVVIQGLFIFFWLTKLNMFGLVSWISDGESYHPIRLFLPLVIYGGIKIAYWFAEPIAELLNIIIGWIITIGIIYFVYWLFFV